MMKSENIDRAQFYVSTFTTLGYLKIIFLNTFLS